MIAEQGDFVMDPPVGSFDHYNYQMKRAALPVQFGAICNAEVNIGFTKDLKHFFYNINDINTNDDGATSCWSKLYVGAVDSGKVSVAEATAETQVELVTSAGHTGGYTAGGDKLPVKPLDSIKLVIKVPKVHGTIEDFSLAQETSTGIKRKQDN